MNGRLGSELWKGWGGYGFGSHYEVLKLSSNGLNEPNIILRAAKVEFDCKLTFDQTLK